MPPLLPGTEVTNWGICEVVGFLVGLVRMLFRLAGFLGFLVILWGAFQYVTAFGQEEKTTRAKNTIYYALIGILVIACSLAIIGLIWQIFGNININLNEIFFGNAPLNCRT
jgi:hypothetical protein